MSVFADSSALVKLYADEPGHRSIRGLTALVVAAIARVEVPAAIWRKQRAGEIAGSVAATLVAEFEADYHGTTGESPRFASVATSGTVLEAGARACAVHGLRAYDAVQLGSAVVARGADPDCVSFAAFDVELRTAASREGFVLFPR